MRVLGMILGVLFVLNGLGGWVACLFFGYEPSAKVLGVWVYFLVAVYGFRRFYEAAE